ncbi:MAG: hypothetical protein AAGC46_14970 [Solirubrobacteraceae bacterium]|nr:hypothetical protein [Patulibacter sp.]
MLIDRAQRSAVLHGSGTADGELLAHPVLAALGIVAAHWAGWVPLHAGAVILNGRAWGVLAERSVGKSTTMASLARAGHGIVTDDLLVIDDRLHAHAGPRSIDLRAESAVDFPEAEELRPDLHHERSRFRLTPGPVPASVPLAGFIRLEWSEDGVSTTPVRPVDRLAVIGHTYSVSARMKNPRLSLDLAALPMYVVARPPRLSSIPETIAALESLAAGA